MKMMLGVVSGLALSFLTVYAFYIWMMMPVVQVSYLTKQVVSCRCEQTHWLDMPADDTACVEVAKGRTEVEWVK